MIHRLSVSFGDSRQAESVVVQQGDVGSRQIEATLYQNSVAFDLSSATVTVLYTVGDVSTSEYPTVLSANKVTFTLPACVTEKAGSHAMQLRVYGTDTLLCSAVLPLQVRQSILPGGEWTDPNVPVLTLLMDQAEEVIRRADTATANANAAAGQARSLPRGSFFYSGTAITGNSGTPAAWPTGIELANVHDRYLYNGNDASNIGNVYRCVTAGNAEAAQWVYDGNLRGQTGAGNVSTVCQRLPDAAGNVSLTAEQLPLNGESAGTTSAALAAAITKAEADTLSAKTAVVNSLRMAIASDWAFAQAAQTAAIAADTEFPWVASTEELVTTGAIVAASPTRLRCPAGTYLFLMRMQCTNSSGANRTFQLSSYAVQLGTVSPVPKVEMSRSLYVATTQTSVYVEMIPIVSGTPFELAFSCSGASVIPRERTAFLLRLKTAEDVTVG